MFIFKEDGLKRSRIEWRRVSRGGERIRPGKRDGGKGLQRRTGQAPVKDSSLTRLYVKDNPDKKYPGLELSPYRAR